MMRNSPPASATLDREREVRPAAPRTVPGTAPRMCGFSDTARPRGPGRLQKLPGLVRGFFADPHLRYITAAA